MMNNSMSKKIFFELFIYLILALVVGQAMGRTFNWMFMNGAIPGDELNFVSFAFAIVSLVPIYLMEVQYYFDRNRKKVSALLSVLIVTLLWLFLI